jgi:hypothetical protein
MGIEIRKVVFTDGFDTNQAKQLTKFYRYAIFEFQFELKTDLTQKTFLKLVDQIKEPLLFKVKSIDFVLSQDQELFEKLYETCVNKIKISEKNILTQNNNETQNKDGRLSYLHCVNSASE